jgi:hypothetical protein
MRWKPWRSSRRREALFWAPVTAVSRRIPGSSARRLTKAAVADLNAALAVRRAVGPQIAEDPSIGAADDEPDSRQYGSRAGVDVADGNPHGLRDPLVQDPSSNVRVIGPSSSTSRARRRVTGQSVTLPASTVQRRCQSAESGTAGYVMFACLPRHCLPDRP